MKHWRRGPINPGTNAKFQDDKDRERTFKEENTWKAVEEKKHRNNLRGIPMQIIKLEKYFKENVQVKIAQGNADIVDYI